jgi:hypothetical protein
VGDREVALELLVVRVERDKFFGQLHPLLVMVEGIGGFSEAQPQVAQVFVGYGEVTLEFHVVRLKRDKLFT